MKKIKLIAIIIFFALKTFAQSNIIEAHFKNGNVNFNDIFEKKFNEAFAGDQVHGCIISATFAKFTIDTLGNIDKLSFSEDKDSPQFVKKLLQDVVAASNGSWIPCTVNGKKVVSKPFILPLVYQLEAGCNVKRAENKTNNALLNLFNFNDGGNPGNMFIQFNLFNCILLPPLNMFTVK